MNSTADRGPRAWFDRSEWKLSPKIFQKINSQLGHLSMDLFASRLSTQLPTFISWKPDPLAMADALTLTWSDILQKVYVCEPSVESDRQSPVTICNRNISELILIGPVWKTQD